MVPDPQPGQRVRANRDIRATEPPFELMAKKGEELEVAHAMKGGAAVAEAGCEWGFFARFEELAPIDPEAR